MGYNAEFGCSRSHRVRISIEENPQNWNPLGSRRLGMEGVAYRLNNPSPLFLFVFMKEFGEMLERTNERPRRPKKYVAKV